MSGSTRALTNGEKRRKLLVKSQARCGRCGYNRNPHALAWHHRDPSAKLLNVSQLMRHGWTRILAEIAKCDLLCLNCHAELHYPYNPEEDTHHDD